MPRKTHAASSVHKPSLKPRRTIPRRARSAQKVSAPPPNLLDGDEVSDDADRIDEPSGYLSVYFREMSRLSILKADEETALAHRIREREVLLWVYVFAQPALIAPLCDVLVRAIGSAPSELCDLRRIAEHNGHKPSEDLQKAAVLLADRLRKLDTDRLYIKAVLEALLSMRQDPQPYAIDLSDKETKNYFRRIGRTAAEVHRAKERFVNANLRLVVSIARRYNNGRMALSDIIQEGNIGLIKAVERFDYQRGYRFSTYASWWIRHTISRGLADKARAVRMPVHMLDIQYKVLKTRRQLFQKLGRSPSAEELSEATGIKREKIERLRGQVLERGISLDAALSDPAGRRIEEVLADESPRAQTADLFARASMNATLRHLLSQLHPVEADILRQRYGVDCEQELTLKQIGEKYNLSRERIRQLQERALYKMRRALARGPQPKSV